MNEAIWQFRLFERASLAYLGPDVGTPGGDSIGLWDRKVRLGAEESG